MDREESATALHEAQQRRELLRLYLRVTGVQQDGIVVGKRLRVQAIGLGEVVEVDRVATESRHEVMHMPPGIGLLAFLPEEKHADRPWRRRGGEAEDEGDEQRQEGVFFQGCFGGSVELVHEVGDGMA